MQFSLEYSENATFDDVDYPINPMPSMAFNPAKTKAIEMIRQMPYGVCDRTYNYVTFDAEGNVISRVPFENSSLLTHGCGHEPCVYWLDDNYFITNAEDTLACRGIRNGKLKLFKNTEYVMDLDIDMSNIPQLFQINSEKIKMCDNHIEVWYMYFWDDNTKDEQQVTHRCYLYPLPSNI